MKSLFIACIFALIPLSIWSQEYDLSNLRGMKDKDGNVLFEMSGYDITISTVRGDVDDESVVNAVKVKYGMGNILAEYSDFYINAENKVIEAEKGVEGRPDMKWNQICYLVSDSVDLITVIYLQTMNQRDIVMEQTFVDTYLNGGLNKNTLDIRDTYTVSFVGRTMYLDSNTKKLEPNNVESGAARISWSEFPSFDSAMQDINVHIQANDNGRMAIMEEADIDVVFEGVPSLAHRVVYKKTVNGKDIIQIMYYIVQEVRGYNVACVLSHNGNSRYDYELPPLLRQVMDIPVIPQPVLSPFEYDLSDDVSEREASKMNILEIQAGAWLPNGSLRNTFKVAPSVGVFLALPVKRNMAIDFGLQMAFPMDRKSFDYYRDGDIYETKSETLFDICLRWRYQHMVARNVFLNTYVGAGVNVLTTDLEYESYDEEQDDYVTKYRSFAAPDLLGGVSLRYKKIGGFVEYHYTPYSMSNRVKGDFGNSAVNIGFTLSFFSN